MLLLSRSVTNWHLISSVSLFFVEFHFIYFTQFISPHHHIPVTSIIVYQNSKETLSRIFFVRHLGRPMLTISFSCCLLSGVLFCLK